MYPLEGVSLAPTFDDEDNGKEILYWEHEGNRAVRRGQWKLVCKYPGEWELYNIDEDRTELTDLSAEHPDVTRELSDLHAAWTQRCHVQPWVDIIEGRRARRQAAGS